MAAQYLSKEGAKAWPKCRCLVKICNSGDFAALALRAINLQAIGAAMEARQSEFVIRHDLTGAQYVELINFSFAAGKTGYFVIREELPSAESARALVRSLGSYLTSAEKVKEWPGTKLLGEFSAILYTFDLAEPVRRFLLNCTDQLFGWVQPNLPEDVGFLDGNGTIFLETTIHEEYLLLRLDDLRSRLIKQKFAALWRTLATSGPTLV
jgi:hypothetical protein